VLTHKYRRSSPAIEEKTRLFSYATRPAPSSQRTRRPAEKSGPQTDRQAGPLTAMCLRVWQENQRSWGHPAELSSAGPTKPLLFAELASHWDAPRSSFPNVTSLWQQLHKFLLPRPRIIFPLDPKAKKPLLALFFKTNSQFSLSSSILNTKWHYHSISTNNTSCIEMCPHYCKLHVIYKCSPATACIWQDFYLGN
jgi:hypothetical protein